jgi:hypothetical protein
MHLREYAQQMSRGTAIADFGSNVFNTFPRFNGFVMALKSRICAFESRTKSVEYPWFHRRREITGNGRSFCLRRCGQRFGSALSHPVFEVATSSAVYVLCPPRRPRFTCYKVTIPLKIRELSAHPTGRSQPLKKLSP